MTPRLRTHWTTPGDGSTSRYLNCPFCGSMIGCLAVSADHAAYDPAVIVYEHECEECGTFSHPHVIVVRGGDNGAA